MRRVGLVVAVGALLVALSAAVALATTTRYGTNYDDEIYGTSGNDTVYGFAGADLIRGYAGADTIYGGGGNDKIYAGSGSGRVYGGSGDDFVSFVGGTGKDYVDCGPGYDTVKKQSASRSTNLASRNCEKTLY